MKSCSRDSSTSYPNKGSGITNEEIKSKGQASDRGRAHPLFFFSVSLTFKIFPQIFLILEDNLVLLLIDAREIRCSQIDSDKTHFVSDRSSNWVLSEFKVKVYLLRFSSSAFLIALCCSSR
ncbi:hypothetical protein K1719_013190 [Acacia pycnantha]|nr:hypothetical protein K1719_013190 [Acacia pycnantha]